MSKRSFRPLRVVLCILLAMLQVIPTSVQAQPLLQDLQNISPDGLNSLNNYLDQYGGSSGLSSQPSTNGQSSVMRPLAKPNVSKVPSALETQYYRRIGEPLRQFGYDVFGGASSVIAPQSGAVQDDYVLGPSDELIIQLRGQANQTFDVRVNRDGQVILPKLNPIAAAGRTLGDVRQDIEAEVGKSYIATRAFVSVGKIRQISVLVAGEVNRPGAITLTALNSPMDALLLAGGVKKTGSLRAIRILRNGKQIHVDLYGVLAGLDVKVPRTLMDGDTIIVPPIGPTVAVTGAVTRPSIYEIAPNQTAIGAKELIHLAGSYVRAGAHRLSVTRVRADGSDDRVPVASLSGVMLHQSEILSVQDEAGASLGRVVLEGQVREPGTYDLTRARTLHDLIGDTRVYDERPYMAYAVISRRDPKTLTRRLIAFAPSEVIAGKFDLPLQDDDVVHIFSVDQVRTLATYLASLGPTAAELGQHKSRGTSTSADQTTMTNTSQRSLLLGQQSQQMLPSQRQQQPSAATAPLTGQPTQQQSMQTQTDPLQALAGLSPEQQQQALSQMSPAERQAALAALAQGPNAQATSQPSYYPPYQAPGLAGQQSYPTQQPPPYLYPGAGYGGYERLGQTPYGANAGNAYGLNQGYPQTNDARNFPPKSTQITSSNLFLDVNDPAVQSQMSTHIVSLLGAVEVPGEYLAAPGVALDTLVDAAGGLKITADLTSVEVTSTELDSETGRASTKRTHFDLPRGQLSRIKIQPDDVVRFREVYSQRDGSQVSIAGQVRYPGTFDLLRGERLSSLLSRAGGLTDVAFPLGAVFLRLSAARAEEQGYKRAAKELERQVPLLANDPNANPVAIQFIRDTITKLENAKGVGRIVVDANPADLIAHPQKDLILEPGDYLMIPRRPNTVSVTGEVLSEGAYLFNSGESAHYYINMAGGYSPGADENRTFILLPDGTARPLRTSLLRFGRNPITPGSTIIVPRNIRPFRFRQFALDLTQIASQLAISAASLSVVSKNSQ